MFLKMRFRYYLMNIVLDPLSFALIDENVDRHIHFDPATEAIPIYILDNILSLMLLIE